MKVLVAMVSSSAHLSGVTRHAANMVRALLTLDEITEVHLLMASWQYDSFRGVAPCDHPKLFVHTVSIGRGPVSRNLWYYFELPALAARLGAEVVHLAYPVPVNRDAFHCPTIVTLHDLYPYDIPSNFGFPKVLFNRMILQQCLRSVDIVSCVSRSTLARLAVCAPIIALRKAAVIYNCVEAPTATSDLSNSNSAPFLLCVAQHRANKNISLALRVFWRLLRDGELASNTKLIIVGIEGPETRRIKGFIRKEKLQQQVELLQGLSDTELHWCYSHCELVLAPSIIEGFGLPVVEATLRGCRIVCSDIPAFREVGGDYCHFASLELADESFLNATRRALGELPMTDGDATRFSSSHIAASYLRLYSELCRSYSASRSDACEGKVSAVQEGVA